ncbi:hypothetical protein SY88_12925 [Clostridiales bacterium PH28_bin88]|nr:hypothetical protein SY88_12925 [Clostridiales bacterium PH28_bin88]
MPDYLSVIGFVAGLVLLVRGADLFTDAVVDTAKKFRLSTLLLGLLVAGAEPEELLASAIAAGKGMSGIAVGNALGTNIAVIGLALALGAAIMPVVADKPSQRHGLIVLVFSLPPVVFLLNGSVTRWEGVLLALLFLVYVWYVVQREKIEIQLEEVTTTQLLAGKAGGEEEEDEDDDDDTRPAWKVVGVVVLGMALMAAGGELLVGGAGSIMRWLHLSETVVGLTFVSIATSAEMIVLSIVPISKGYSEITIGGIIGSYAYNVMLTLGVAAAIRPLAVSMDLLSIDLPVMLGFYALLLIFTYQGRLTRTHGVVLLASYLVYLIYNFTLR